MDFPDLPFPQTIEETEDLVQRFYKPGSPQAIHQVDRCLQRLQKSNQAWELAEALMASTDANVRYFAALTFIVKINRDWANCVITRDELKEEQKDDMLRRLLAWFVKTVNANAKNGRLVSRKLCSALVAIFVKTTGNWPSCIRHVVMCLYAKQTVANIDPCDDLVAMMYGLEPHQFVAAVSFGIILIQEMSDMGEVDETTLPYYKALGPNVPVMLRLIQCGLEKVEMADQEKEAVTEQKKCVEESVKLFQNLTALIVHEPEEVIDPGPEMATVMTQVFKLLRNDKFFEVVAEMAGDALRHYNFFLHREHSDLVFEGLGTGPGLKRFQDLVHGSNETEALAWAWLFLHLGGHEVVLLVTDCNESPYKDYLALLLQVTGRPGIAVEDDQTIKEVLDFWGELVTEAQEKLYGPKAPPEETPAKLAFKDLLSHAVNSLLVKIRQPPMSIWSDWDSDERAKFGGLRRDFQHFLSTVYTFFGPHLFALLGNHTVAAGQRRDWDSVEAGLVAISGIADAAADSTEMDASLGMLFGSSLWHELVTAELVPPWARNAAVNLVAAYSPYFQRNPQSLDTVITFLFRCLDAPAIAQTAARTIPTLCDVCRGTLAPFAQSFVDQYASFVDTAARPADVKEKLIGAVAAVIQGQSASDDPQQRQAARAALAHLLSIVENEVSAAFQEPNRGQTRERSREALLCLASMGRGYRVPDSAVIDLDPEQPESGGPGSESEILETSELQKRIAQLCHKVLFEFRQNEETVEAVCNVFRAGIPESSGPFMMTMELYDQVLGQALLYAAQPAALMETLARVLRKRKADAGTAEMEAYTRQFRSHVVALTSAMRGDPSVDPEMAAAALDFFRNYIPEYLISLGDDCLYLCCFATNCIASHEILPRRSGCAFWAAVLELPAYASLGLDASVGSEGLRLGEALMFAVGGNVPRSELEAVMPPLRRLISNRKEAHNWCWMALCHDDFPSKRMSEEEKRVFLHKILKLRGAARTTDIVKDFWVKCRGTFAA